MTDQTAGIGHNEAPEGDPFALQIEEKNTDLWRMLGALEMRRLKLPKEPKTEEEAALVTTWVADARELMRTFEDRRKEVKEPYLRRGQTIDKVFNPPKEAINAKALDVEKRNGPYLRAKREREEAERRAQAKIAREKQEAIEREAAEARRLEREAQERREREEREARDAEQRRVREEEDARRAQESDVAPLAPAEPAPSAEANQERMRQANLDEQAAIKRREALEAESRKAALAADRADKRADQTGQLGKVTTGGANQRADMVWVARVDSWSKVMQSVGPLAPYLNEQIIRGAIDRAAKHPSRPEIPGVSYAEELAVKTTTRRA